MQTHMNRIKHKTIIFVASIVAMSFVPGWSLAQSKTPSTAFKLRGAKISYYYDDTEKKLYEINSAQSCKRVLNVDTSSGKPQHKINNNSFSQTFTLNLDESPPNVRIDSSVRGGGNRIPIDIIPCANGDCKAQSFRTCD